jgi:hypothetical protein
MPTCRTDTESATVHELIHEASPCSAPVRRVLPVAGFVRASLFRPCARAGARRPSGLAGLAVVRMAPDLGDRLEVYYFR